MLPLVTFLSLYTPFVIDFLLFIVFSYTAIQSIVLEGQSLGEGVGSWLERYVQLSTAAVGLSVMMPIAYTHRKAARFS